MGIDPRLPESVVRCVRAGARTRDRRFGRATTRRILSHPSILLVLFFLVIIIIGDYFLINTFIKIRSQSYALETVLLFKTTSFFILREYAIKLRTETEVTLGK